MVNLVVDVRPWNKDFAIAALEAGIAEIIVPDSRVTEVEELGVLRVINERELSGRFIETMMSPDNQDAVLQLIGERGKRDVLVIVDRLDVVSLENLVAADNHFYVQTRSPDEVTTAANLLDKGVQGIVLMPRSVNDIWESARIVSGQSEEVILVDGEVTQVMPAGIGYRVFVDTLCLMTQEQGMLIGNTTHGYFLVLSESFENPYTGKRPFRVNAGGLHSYSLKPDNLTQYLSEFTIGEPLLIVHTSGATERSRVGRVKIERRPLVLVRAQYKDISVSHYFQNASTVHVFANGRATPVTRLSGGDTVRMCVKGLEGRHYGMKIEERVMEK